MVYPPLKPSTVGSTMAAVAMASVVFKMRAFFIILFNYILFYVVGNPSHFFMTNLYVR